MSNVAINSPTAQELASMPLRAEVQYYEPAPATAINRILDGIMPDAFYRGFTLVGSSNSLHVTVLANDGRALVATANKELVKVAGQADVSNVAVVANKTNKIYLKVNFAEGTITKQIDKDAALNAVEVIVKTDGSVPPSSLLIGTVMVPNGATSITEGMINYANVKRFDWGNFSYQGHNHDGRYALKEHVLTHVPVNAKFTDTHRAITDSLTSTSSSTSASAKAAKTLDDKIDNLSVNNIARSVARPTDLGSDSDLNDCTTPGSYAQISNARAAAGSNYPTDKAGHLRVYHTAGLIQVYREYATGQTYERGFYNNKWSIWAKSYSTLHKPLPADIGALAATATAVNSQKLNGYSLRDVVKRGVATYYGTGNISIDLSIDAHTHNVIRWGSVDGEITMSGMPTVGTKVIVNNVRNDSGRVTVSYDKSLYLPNSQHTSPHTFDGRGRFIFECYHSSGNLMLTGAWEG